MALIYISLSALSVLIIASLCLEMEKSTTSAHLSMFCSCDNTGNYLGGVYPPVLRNIDIHAQTEKWAGSCGVNKPCLFVLSSRSLNNVFAYTVGALR